ncbi:MAG: helix-turn-helix domain-containing protein [Dehalococcoidia bacterium]
MTSVLNGETYLRTAEACKAIGVSKSTLLRWFARGTIVDVPHRDRRGWRLFSSDDLIRIKSEADRVVQQK